MNGIEPRPYELRTYNYPELMYLRDVLRPDLKKEIEAEMNRRATAAYLSYGV